MIRRQQRIERIAAVAKEYLAAKSASDLLMARFKQIKLRIKSWLGIAGWRGFQRECRFDLHHPPIC